MLLPFRGKSEVLPERRAGLRVDAQQVSLPPEGQDHVPAVERHAGRRLVVLHDAARVGRVPDRLAGGLVQRDNRGALAPGRHDHPLAVEQGRGGDRVPRRLRPPVLQQVPLPDERPVAEPHRADLAEHADGEHKLAIRGGGRAAPVVLDLAGGVVGGAPDVLPRRQADAAHHVARVVLAVQQQDAVPVDGGSSVARADRRLPEQLRPVLRPGAGQALRVVRHAVPPRPQELRPVSRPRGRAEGQRGNAENDGPPQQLTHGPLTRPTTRRGNTSCACRAR